MEQEQAITKLIRLRDARNKRAAHGGAHTNRKSTYYEVLDYRELSYFVLSNVIKHRTGLDINTLLLPKPSF
jgi:hypothetical protein